MRDFFTAIVRFLFGPGSGILIVALVGLGYYLAKN
jgi:hypothetical protein